MGISFLLCVFFSISNTKSLAFVVPGRLGGHGCHLATVEDVDWRSLFFEERAELLRSSKVMDALFAETDAMRKDQDEELRKLWREKQRLSAELMELKLLKTNVRRDKLHGLIAGSVTTYRKLMDRAIFETVGFTWKNVVLDDIRHNIPLLQRYERDPAITRDLTEKQLPRSSWSSFADKMAKDLYDLYEFIRTEIPPTQIRFIDGEIDLRSSALSKKDMMLLYHFLDIAAYPVRHPGSETDPPPPHA